MNIVELPEFIVHQIAAGEVIDRPAAIVKELIENSIDANATKIEIKISDAGKNYISIKDNGSGIQKDDLQKSVKMHATSKLKNLNLHEINFLGFRGEALASISSVTRMSIESKYIDDEDAWKAHFENSKLTKISPSNIQNGTLIEVKDLFFSIPARLNFLKTNQTELIHLITTVKRIAIPFPSIAFKFFDENRLMLNYNSENQKKRIINVLGKDIENDLIFFSSKYATEEEFINAQNVEIKRSEETSIMKHETNFLKPFYEKISISGYVSKPTFNAKNTDSQYIYVNNRFIKDKILSIAIKSAYSDLIPKDRHPICVIFITIDNDEIDVNVHPRKLEIRFKNQKEVQKFVTKHIREKISENSNKFSNTLIYAFQNLANLSKTNDDNSKNSSPNFCDCDDEIPNFDFQTKQNPQELNGEYINFYQTSESNKDFDHQIKNNFIADSIFGNTAKKIQTDFAENPQNASDFQLSSLEEKNEIPKNDEKIDLGSAIFQLENKYIISSNGENLCITDQHAVHERFVFEKLKNNFLHNEFFPQKLVIPEFVALDECETAAILSLKQDLQKMCFIIEKTSDNSQETEENSNFYGINVLGIPQILKNVNIKKLVKDIISEIIEINGTHAIDEKINRILATFACHTSIRAGQKLSIPQMNQILRFVENEKCLAQCNHGRPSYVIFSTKNIDKIFER